MQSFFFRAFWRGGMFGRATCVGLYMYINSRRDETFPPDSSEPPPPASFAFSFVGVFLLRVLVCGRLSRPRLWALPFRLPKKKDPPNLHRQTTLPLSKNKGGNPARSCWTPLIRDPRASAAQRRPATPPLGKDPFHALIAAAGGRKAPPAPHFPAPRPQSPPNNPSIAQKTKGAIRQGAVGRHRYAARCRSVPRRRLQQVPLNKSIQRNSPQVLKIEPTPRHAPPPAKKKTLSAV